MPMCMDAQGGQKCLKSPIDGGRDNCETRCGC